MQTTLLGLAIAFIIALLAALIGPYFIDWNQFRPQFEAEASRVVGAQVRVGGALDARLLPTPSLSLRSVVVGGPNDLGKVRAEKLDVEFSLGSLMRGEWRATELTINGMALDLGLGRQGRLDWPASSGNASLGSLAIDRLNLTGRIALHDAASRSTLELSDIAFSGDVRALAGSIRGDGNFTWSGTRYPFRVSSGQSGDGTGVRLHLGLESGVQGTAADLDGILMFEQRAPRFDGTVTLAGGSATKAGSNAGAPWRISAKLKADAARARFEQLETSYGFDDAALKLAGNADLQFGASPVLRAKLSARQLDADKLLSKRNGAAEPTRWLANMRALLGTVPQAPLPVQVEISSEQIMLGGRAIQDLNAGLRADERSWTVERLGLRAPGGTDVSLRGVVASNDPSTGFGGAFNLNSSDPALLIGWLSGRAENYRSQKPLRVSGQVDFASDRIAVTDLKAEIDGGTLSGRIALFARGLSGDSEFDGALTADRLDLDTAAAFVRAVGGPQAEWPDRAQLTLNVASAMSSGQELRPFAVNLGYDPKNVTLAQLKIGSVGGMTVEGAGAFNRDETTGKLTLNAAATSVDQLTTLLKPLAPTIAERIAASNGSASGAARLKLAVDLGKNSKDRSLAEARATVDIGLPQVSGVVTLTATPKVQLVRGIDADALAQSEFTADWKLASPHAAPLLGLLTLDRIVAATTDASAQLDGTLSGKWRAPMRVQTKLSGSDIDAEIQGTVNAAAERPTADINLTVRRGNFAPLLNLKPSNPTAQNISLSSHLTLADGKLGLANIDGNIGGTRVRGRMTIALSGEKVVDGELGMDSLDLPKAFAFAIGAAEDSDANDPLGRGLLQGWQGRLGFQALRGVLAGGTELLPVSGTIKSDGQSFNVTDIKGGLGGGEVRAAIEAKPSSAGLALNAQVQLSGVDGAALRYRSLVMPEGRAAMQMTLASQGRSISALAGALSGNGTLTLDAARIAGLDAKAMDTAIQASDSGQVSSDAKLRSLVESALSSGSFAVGKVQIPFSIRDGRLSVGATVLESDGAKAVVSGGYDFIAEQADLRVSLTPAATGQGARPAIEVFAVGTPDGLHRTVDVTALSSWLAVRAIDRETRRLEALERSAAMPPVVTPPATPTTPPPENAAPRTVVAPAEPLPSGEVPLPGSDPRRSPAKPKATAPPPAVIPDVSSVSSTPQVAPLPPPIEIRPAPGARVPKPRAPLVIAPPPAAHTVR